MNNSINNEINAKNNEENLFSSFSSKFRSNNNSNDIKSNLSNNSSTPPFEISSFEEKNSNENFPFYSNTPCNNEIKKRNYEQLITNHSNNSMDFQFIKKIKKINIKPYLNENEH